jgi:hypothetical protein
MYICFPRTVCCTLLESKLDTSLVSIMFLTCGAFVLPRHMHRTVLHVTLWTTRFRRIRKQWNVDRNRPDLHKWRSKVLLYRVLFLADYLTAVNTSDTITWSTAIRDTSADTKTGTPLYVRRRVANLPCNLWKNWDSEELGIATHYGEGRPGFLGSSRFFLFSSVQTACEPHRNSYTKGTGLSFPRVITASIKADHWTSTSAQVKECGVICPLPPPYVFYTYCLIKKERWHYLTKIFHKMYYKVVCGNLRKMS